MTSFSEINGILFDKDGTLLDFEKTWLAPYKAAASYVAKLSNGRLDTMQVLADGGYIEQTGAWVPDSLLAAGSNGQIVASWEDLLGVKLSDADRRDIANCFEIGVDQYIAAIPDMHTSLTMLKKAGYRLGIATMDDEQHAHTMVQGLQLDGLFDFVCGADSGYGVKPEPGMILAFADAVGLQPAQVAMVGDSPRDINMGINAGAGLSVGVLTGAHDSDQLARLTSHVLDDIGLLQKYLSATASVNLNPFGYS